MIVLLLVGFLGGLVTGISPCILPVLPVIFASGAASGIDDGATAVTGDRESVTTDVMDRVPVTAGGGVVPAGAGDGPAGTPVDPVPAVPGPAADARARLALSLIHISGMLAPNMATMLAFLTTDAAVEPGPLADVLRAAVDDSCLLYTSRCV